MTDDTVSSTTERTLKLVEALLAQPGGVTPQDLLARLGSSRSTLFLLLHTLKRLGYVEQAEKRGRYSPGPRLRAWQSAPAIPAADLSRSPSS